MKWMCDWLILSMGLESFTLRMKERERGRQEEGSRVGWAGTVLSTCCLVFQRAIFLRTSKENFERKLLTLPANLDAVAEMRAVQCLTSTGGEDR